MVVPVSTRRLLLYPALALATAGATLLLLQVVLGRRLEQAQTIQMGNEVAFNLRLTQLALEHYGPEAIAEISGLRLQTGRDTRPGGEGPFPGRLRRQAGRLEAELCRLLSHCPAVVPAGAGPRGVWVELVAPLETVWMFVPLPALPGWPPGPLPLTLALGAGALASSALFLALEVQRPLRQLEGALARVDLERRPEPVPSRGTGAVRQLTHRFNAMLERLEQSSQERTTMLAGIGHDLRSPLTRLRLRLGLGGDPALAEADLAALERITRQFLVFAGAEAAEAAQPIPLDALVSEAAAAAHEWPLSLDLEPLERRVRPAAIARALANLIDNAIAHGKPPLRLVLTAWGPSGFEIQLWDSGPGIDPAQWRRAVQPFQRLDQARSGPGHCGLGLAIAERVASDHGGSLTCRRASELGETGFAVVLRGRSLPLA